MNIKLSAVLMAALVAWTGCSEAAPTPTPAPTEKINPAPAQPSFNLEQVVGLIKSQQLELHESEAKGAWSLNGVTPSTFVVNDPLAKMIRAESVHVYVFKNAKEREKGLEDFHKERDKYNMIVPSVWQNGNALVIYWHGTSIGYKTVFEERISKALAGWQVVIKHEVVAK